MKASQGIEKLQNLIKHPPQKSENREDNVHFDIALDLEDRQHALLVNGRILEIIEEASEEFPVSCDPFPGEYLASYSWLEALAWEDQEEFLEEIREEIRASYRAINALEITLDAWRESARLLRRLEENAES